jgi:uncharacterized repeat protein (TIGR01451 family)
MATTSTDTAESDDTNNEAEASTSVEQLADVSVGKVAEPNPAIAGGFLTYSLVVKNEGPSDADEVMVADTLPLGTKLISANVIQDAAIIHSIDTTKWVPSSPDPAGMAYIPSTDRLMVSDSEVNERPINRDENLYDVTRPGEMFRVTTTIRFTDEPTGLAYDPASETLFVSDDIADEIYMVLAGDDGIFGTSDDTVDFFNTAAFLNVDPEGLAYDPFNNHIFSIDGFNNSVFIITPGDNGVFDGVPGAPDFGDDVVTSFDTTPMGIRDPEGIVFNPETGTLFVGDHRNPKIIETTVNGVHLRTFNLTPDTIEISGLTIAPSTANPSVLSLYASDRGVDNNEDPEENDGKIYEIFIPEPSGPNGSCTSGLVVECDLGTVGAGESALVSIVVQVDVLASGSLSNDVEVSTATQDDNGDNDSDTIETPIRNMADLNLTKTDFPDPVRAGEQLTYTLVISNPGPSHALGVTVEDTLPVSTTFSSYTISQGISCLDNGKIECELGDLLAGTVATVTLVVDVDADAPFTLTNYAETKSLTTDDFLDDNEITIDTTVTKEANLAISKASWPEIVTAGTNLTYTLVVTNIGPSSAEGVVVTDTLPAGVSLVSSSTSQGAGCTNSATPVCELGTIAANAQASITLVVNVSSAVSTTLMNVADVDALTTDPFPDNNHAEELTLVATSADLSLLKEATPEPVAAGSTLTYTLTISNAGPSDAVGVVVTDTLPGGVTFVSADPSGCVENGQVVCQLGTISAGQEIVLSIVTSLAPSLAPQSIENSAEVASETDDPDDTNNDDSAISTVVTAADLVITKEASPDPVTAGDNLTYTLTIQNLGPSNASDIVVTDTLPVETTLVSVDSSQGAPCNGTTVIDCAIGDLDLLASAEITIVVTVDSAASGTITNTAEVKGAQQDPEPENNLIAFITSVNTEGSLPFVKVDDPDPVTAGTNLTYTLSVSSTGPSDATNVVLTDTLPSGVQFVSVDQDRGSCSENSGVVTCDFGDMPVGTDATVEIVVTVNTDVVGQINNEATVTADTAVPSVVNQNTTVVASADLAITNMAEPTLATPGGNITFTIEVSNSGPSLADLVVVNNTLSPELSFISSPDCAPLNDAITCAIGDVDAGQSVQTYIVVQVANDASGPVSNAATVFSSTSDPEPGNNSSTAISLVIPETDLSIGKSAYPSEVLSGDILTYTLTITNDGPSLATGVIVTDTLPADVEKISATPSQGFGCVGTSIVVCQLDDINSSATATVTIVVQIDWGFSGVLANTAAVSGTEADPNESNNSTVLETDVEQKIFYLYLPITIR